MNLHQIPAFTQNVSIKLTCCGPEAVMMLYVLYLSRKVKKLREKIFSKNRVSPLCCSSSSSSSSGCHGLAVIW